VEIGTFAALWSSGAYLKTLKYSQKAGDDDNTAEFGQAPPNDSSSKGSIINGNGKAVKTAPTTTTTAKSRGAGNSAAMRYYIKSMGHSSFWIFIAIVLFQTACRLMTREKPVGPYYQSCTKLTILKYQVCG
jgi:hypothetical protein